MLRSEFIGVECMYISVILRNSKQINLHVNKHSSWKFDFLWLIATTGLKKKLSRSVGFDKISTNKSGDYVSGDKKFNYNKWTSSIMDRVLDGGQCQLFI